MSDLLQSQIKESCKLALPNGLKELMSDISREVLRAQPSNLYGFITNYLSALLVSRENLSVACRLCKDICDPTCHPELEDELRNIGLTEEDVVKAKNVIDKYFDDGKAEESTLMVKLLKKCSISEDQLEMVQEAVRNAFLLHHINNTDDNDRQVPSDGDEISRACIHTLQLYGQTGPSEEDYNQKARTIQAEYRAYGVRRLCKSKPALQKDKRNIRFNADTIGADIDASEMDMDESSENNTLQYDPTAYKEFDENSSQSKLCEESNDERIISHTTYNTSYPEKVQSFVSYAEEIVSESNYSDNSAEDTINVNAKDIFNHKNERKSSNISEVHFSEPVICTEVPKNDPKIIIDDNKEITDDPEEIIDESNLHDFATVNEKLQLDYEQSTNDPDVFEPIIHDHAVNADNDSEASVEEKINENESDDELADVDIINL